MRDVGKKILRLGSLQNGNVGFRLDLSRAIWDHTKFNPLLYLIIPKNKYTNKNIEYKS